MSQTNDLISRIQETIDKTTTATEKVHKAIMNMPLDIIEKIAPLDGLTKSVRRIQNSIVGSIYDIIRTANSEVLVRGTTSKEMVKRHQPGQNSKI